MPEVTRAGILGKDAATPKAKGGRDQILVEWELQVIGFRHHRHCPSLSSSIRRL